MTEEKTPRRDEIDRLWKYVIPVDSADHVAAAQVLALLEIADAIDRLAGEIEKAGWKKG